MKYDFTTSVDRSGSGSSKWAGMRAANLEVPEGIIPFSVADMELKNPPEIMAGLRDYLRDDELILGYTGPTESYKRAVQGFMKRRHCWDFDLESLVTSPGVVPALSYGIKAFTQPGDGVIIFSPVYYPFSMMIDMSGRVKEDVPLINTGRRYEIDWAGFEQAAKKPETKLFLLCSPHNPVGRVWLCEELLRISEICAANGVLVISDEVHGDLIMPGFKHTVFATVSEEAAQNCVICTAPSKTFNLAGMQTSNIIIPNRELREKFSEELLRSAVFGLNILGYKACEIAYTQCDKWLEELLVLIDANRRLTEDFMAERIPEIIVYPLEGSYLQWWDCRALGMEAEELEHFMQHKALLFLDEGYIFGETGAGFERINLACPNAVLQEALERLARALGERK